jgi:hypothetical protein
MSKMSKLSKTSKTRETSKTSKTSKTSEKTSKTSKKINLFPSMKDSPLQDPLPPESTMAVGRRRSGLPVESTGIGAPKF